MKILKNYLVIYVEVDPNTMAVDFQISHEMFQLLEFLHSVNPHQNKVKDWQQQETVLLFDE